MLGFWFNVKFQAKFSLSFLSQWCSVCFLDSARQKATSYFDKSRGSLLITGAHCDIQPNGIQGFNIIDTQQRGQHPRLLKESLSIECRTLLLYPPPKRSKLGEVPAIFPARTMTVVEKIILRASSSHKRVIASFRFHRLQLVLVPGTDRKSLSLLTRLGQFDDPGTYATQSEGSRGQKDENNLGQYG